MAEGKGANIARLMTKQAGRAKEKVTLILLKSELKSNYFMSCEWAYEKCKYQLAKKSVETVLNVT